MLNYPSCGLEISSPMVVLYAFITCVGVVLSYDWSFSSIRTGCDTKISLFFSTSSYVTEPTIPVLVAHPSDLAPEKAREDGGFASKSNPTPILSFEERLGKQVHGGIVRLPPSGRRSSGYSKGMKSFMDTNDEVSTPKALHNALVEADAKADFLAASERYHGKVVSGKLVQGTMEKRSILEAYESAFNPDPASSIVAKKKGKTDDTSKSLVRMKISGNRYYRVDELTLYNVVAPLIVSGYLDQQQVARLSMTCKFLKSTIPKVLYWSTLDFSSLREPRLDYNNQTTIDQKRVDMANAAMVHFGLDPGKFVRWMKGEFTGEHRDVARVLSSVKDHVSPDDLAHLKRILCEGCPSQVRLTEPLANKLKMIERGNSAPFNENVELTSTAMNKEERNSHVIALDEDMCLLSAYCRHTAQTVIIKPGKNDRVCWDASTTREVDDMVMNQPDVTIMDDEAQVTFGNVKMQFLTDIWNTRISNPAAILLLATADIKACYRYPRVSPDLTGAFGFLAVGFFFLATAMVFGSTASCSSWEPFRRAIEILTAFFANRQELVEKHKVWLDMINWDELDFDEPLTPAFPCQLNTGLPKDADGNPPALPARIYVDDGFVLGLSVAHMKQTLAALIEAIFVVLGLPEIDKRQCPLALDKWVALIVGPVQTFLGLTVNTSRMMVSIPRHYLDEVLVILNETWHPCRKQFTAQEAQTLTGKLAHLAQAAPWVFHLLTHMYASVAHALRSNKALLAEDSKKFKDLLDLLRSEPRNPSDRHRIVNFALKMLAKMTHHSSTKYNITKTMRYEIEFFREELPASSGTRWETPIAHIVKRSPSFTCYGDSCLDGAGGYSVELGFWWHIKFPDDIVQRTLLHRANNDDGKLISINVLEFITVIINYMASLHVLRLTKPTEDPYPVLLNITDNSSAQRWTTTNCKGSTTGRLLARLFCSLLINSPLGINSKWIPTADNYIADEISRLKHAGPPNSPPSFDYGSLKQKYQELRHCSFFQLNQEVAFLLWEIALTERWPCRETIELLKQKPLGKLITLNGPK